MNIHEYQARELLQKFGVATPRGKVASTPEEAEQVARDLGDVAEPGEAGLLQQKQRAGPEEADRRSWATQPIDPIGCLWREAGRSCDLFPSATFNRAVSLIRGKV